MEDDEEDMMHLPVPTSFTEGSEQLRVIIQNCRGEIVVYDIRSQKVSEEEEVVRPFDRRLN